MIQAQLAEMAAAKQPSQRGQDPAIGPGQPRVLDLALEHGDLVTQDQDLRVLGAVGPGEQGEDPEAIQPGEAVSFTLLQEQLHSVLGTLSEREAGVVSRRFGLTDGQPKTLDEIGKVYGVTRERIRQIESKAMSKLRHPSWSNVLRDYLD